MTTASLCAKPGAQQQPTAPPRCTWEKLYSPCINRLQGLWLITLTTGYASIATVDDFGTLTIVSA